MLASDQSIYLNKWLLTFRDAEIKAAHEEQHKKKVLQVSSKYLPFVLMLYALFTILDIYALPQTYQKIILLRFGVIIPLLLTELLLIALIREKLYNYCLLFNLFEFLVLMFGILMMLCLANPNEVGYATYIMGLFIISLWCITPKYNIIETTVYLLLMVFCYNLIAIFNLELFDHNFSLFLTNNFFLFSFYISCMLVAYVQKDTTKKSFFLQYRLNKLSQNLEEQVQQRTEQLEIERQKTNKALIDGQEMERTRLGQDLHDDLGIQIISLKHQVEIDQQHPSYEKMNVLYYRIDQLYQSMRGISKNMLPYSLKKMGLILSIQDLCNNLEEKMDHLQVITKLDTSLVINCQTTQIYLYRIIQELISNTIKHAKAATITIALFQQEGTIKLIVADDGIGFDENKAFGGIGIRNVIARIHLLRGKYQFKSPLHKGSRIEILIPSI